MARVVDSLPQLLDTLQAAEKVTRGDPDDCCEWMHVQLAGLYLRENSDRPTADHHWAAVQVTSLTVDGETYSLSPDLDAHITIGSWMKKPSASSWSKYFTRAVKKLADTPMLDMEMKPNADGCDTRRLIFSFMVHSQGGVTLHALSQTLNACDLRQWDLGRGMSPPGRVLHLSVYDTRVR